MKSTLQKAAEATALAEATKAIREIKPQAERLPALLDEVNSINERLAAIETLLSERLPELAERPKGCDA